MLDLRPQRLSRFPGRGRFLPFPQQQVDLGQGLLILPGQP